MRDGASAEIAVYAHEGLIKQHLTEKTIQKLLLAQLNRELSAGDKSLHTASLNLEIPPVFLRFRSLSGTISHPASTFTIQLDEQ